VSGDGIGEGMFKRKKGEKGEVGEKEKEPIYLWLKGDIL